MTLHITYSLLDLPNSRPQAVHNADRRLCAYVAALRSHKIGGMLPPGDVHKAIRDELNTLEVPPSRVKLWTADLPLGIDDVPVTVAGLTLDEYQREAIARLRIGGGVLALGCGLGKTLTAIAAAIAAHKWCLTPRILILAPLNALSSWKRYKDHLEALGWEVLISSMDSAHKLKLPNRGGVIIYDEVHLQGHSTARRTKAAHDLRPLFDVGLCLTGTFLHGGVEKTLSMLDLAIPGAAGFANRWSCGEYFKCLVRKKLGQRVVTAIEKPSGSAKTAFFAYLSRYVIHLTSRSESVSRDVSIPEQYIHTQLLGKPWRPMEEEAVDYIKTQMADGQPIPHASEVAHYLCRQGVDDKVDWLMEQLAGDDEPVVVFAHYTDSIEAIRDRFLDEGVTYMTVDGATSASDRVMIRNEFIAGKYRVLLGQVIAAGIGMDGLQERTRFSVMIDHPWRPDAYAQALARVCRRGQDHECHHVDLIANSLQQTVVDRLRAGTEFDAACHEWQELRRVVGVSHV
jgi:hypothetical protein